MVILERNGTVACRIPARNTLRQNLLHRLLVLFSRFIPGGFIYTA
jgi:hypothetical protein